MSTAPDHESFAIPWRSRLYRALLLLLSFACVACGRPSTEDRVRTYFALPHETPDDTASLRDAILRRIPPGTSMVAVESLLTAHGVDRDGLSQYARPNHTDTAALRVDFDSRGWNPVSSSYLIRFAVDSAARLRDVRVTRWLTGP